MLSQKLLFYYVGPFDLKLNIKQNFIFCHNFFIEGKWFMILNIKFKIKHWIYFYFKFQSK